ncbi:MAG: GntR family transcriptional regulator [Hyphomicrobiaceae bacterium]|nr:GntR family transcriptional regulator [Hyphomicrobiaceae bacterium]
MLQAGFSGPLYQQVHESLKSRITNGEWKGGMVIPGDAELSRQLGVSIGTVRKALDELARERLVVRERGRGTFIKDPSHWCGELDTWLCDNRGRPLQADITVEMAETGEATLKEQKELQLKSFRNATPRVHRVLRTWRHSGRVVCAERLLVNVLGLPNLLENADLTAPLLSAAYMGALRKSTGRTVWSFSLELPDQELLSVLDASTWAKLVACRRALYDSTDAPLEVAEQVVHLADDTYRLSC